MAYKLITSHGGHNEFITGAFGNGYAEHTFVRELNKMFLAGLAAVGQKCVDTTDDIGRMIGGIDQNLPNIVRNCNAWSANGRLDVSNHLNAGGGTGVEVWFYDQKELAEKVSAAIAQATGLKNRGAKQSKDLYVLKNTNAPAILIEWCFIDNADDMKKLVTNKQAAVNAVVTVVTGKKVETTQPKLEASQPNPAQSKKQKIKLPASAQTWRVYPLNKQPTIGNEVGLLAPARYGGLTYDVIRWVSNDVAVINTGAFGQVQIFVGPLTGAQVI